MIGSSSTTENPHMQIQKLRLQRGWSQQQLAEFSGLSSRTIQRIEAGQPASPETLKSLAAVFEIPFTDLQAPPEMPATVTLPPTASITELEEAAALRHVRQLRRFYLHLLRYLLVVSVLGVFNLVRSPQHLWFLWVAGGWGLGLLLHASRVFGNAHLLGPQWERRQVEKRLGRPL